MSGTDARERAARAAVPPQASGERTGPVLPAGTGRGHPRGRRRWVTAMVVGLVVGLAAGAGAVWLAGGFRALGAACVSSPAGHPRN